MIKLMVISAIIVLVLVAWRISLYFKKSWNKDEELLETVSKERNERSRKIALLYNEEAVASSTELTLTISVIERIYGAGKKKRSCFIVKITAECLSESRDYYYESSLIYNLITASSMASEFKSELEAQKAVHDFLLEREKRIREKENNTLVSEKVIKSISANLPPTTEELVEHVNQMSETDFNNFLSLLDQGGRYPLRKREEVLVLK